MPTRTITPLRAHSLLVAATLAVLALGAAPARAREPTSAASVLAAADGARALPGGDDESYGYGATRGPQGPVVDLRGAARAEPMRQDGAAPAWLEQEKVGPPYEAGGRWYVPAPEPGYEQTGRASWYGEDFRARPTASGETFDPDALTAAHPTLPIPSLVQVTNLETGREAILRVNDRGPFVDERLIDVSQGAARVLGFERAGGAQVHVRYLGPAPRHVVTTTSGVRTVAFDPEPRAGPLSLGPQIPESTVSAAPAPSPISFSPQVAAPAHGFYVQVGAYGDGANAERARVRIAAVGEARIDVRMNARGTLHRVRVGPFASRGAAEDAQRQIAALGYPDALVATD